MCFFGQFIWMHYIRTYKVREYKISGKLPRKSKTIVSLDIDLNTKLIHLYMSPSFLSFSHNSNLILES